MPTRELDAVFFIEKAPSVSFRDGHFHVCYDIGRRAVFEVVMSPRVFMEARLRGSEVCAKWQFGTLPDEDKVKSFRKP